MKDDEHAILADDRKAARLSLRTNRATGSRRPCPGTTGFRETPFPPDEDRALGQVVVVPPGLRPPTLRGGRPGTTLRSRGSCKKQLHSTLAGRLLLLAYSVLAVACAHPLTKVCRTLVPEPPPALGTVQVSFLGVGGVIIRWQGQAIMTAPLYSNPTVAEMALSEIHVDRQRVDELMRDGLHDVEDVRAILAGHSHYDHLLEVPYIALHRARSAEILGNNAMVKLLDPIAKAPSSRKLVALESPASPVHDVPGTRFRIRSVVSQHSPQIGPRLAKRVAGILAPLLPMPEVSLWRGEDEYPSAELPVRVGRWYGGTTLAFVIELLEPSSDKVAFRIYYQDSSSKKPYGFPVPGDPAQHFDLAILCMGGATEYQDFPGDIVHHLQPKYVMGVHWEDFFNPRALPDPGETDRTEQLRYAPGVDEQQFLKAVRAAQPTGGRALVPCPDKTTVFMNTGGIWTLVANDPDWSAPK